MISPSDLHFYRSYLRSYLNRYPIYSILSPCYTKTKYYYNFSIDGLNYSNLIQFTFIFAFCYFPATLNIQNKISGFLNWLNWVFHPNNLQCLANWIFHFNWTTPSIVIDWSYDFSDWVLLTSKPSFAAKPDSSSVHLALSEITETFKLCYVMSYLKSFGCELFRFLVGARFITTCFAREIAHYFLATGYWTASSWSEPDYCACSSTDSMLPSCDCLNFVLA